MLATDVEIRVTGMIARARVHQEFTNPSREWAEGVYVFPLPDDAAVDHLTMRVGDRIIEGMIREREAAKATYVQARQQGQRTSLVEQERPNVFTTSLANIPPGAAITIEIEYQQTVHYDAGEFRLRFPDGRRAPLRAGRARRRGRRARASRRIPTRCPTRHASRHPCCRRITVP